MGGGSPQEADEGHLSDEKTVIDCQYLIVGQCGRQRLLSRTLADIASLIGFFASTALIIYLARSCPRRCVIRPPSELRPCPREVLPHHLAPVAVPLAKVRTTSSRKVGTVHTKNEMMHYLKLTRSAAVWTTSPD